MSNKSIIFVFIGLLLFSLTAAGYAGGNYLTQGTNEILPGIMVKDREIGGLTIEQATEELSVLERQMLNTPVTLTFNNQSWPLSLEEVGFRVDKEQTLNRAVKIGQEGSFIERFQLKRKISREGYTLQPVVAIDYEKLSLVVNGLMGHINELPQDAVFIIDEQDRVVITPSKEGKRIDVERLQLSLQKEVLVSENIVIPLPVVVVKPAYSTEEIEGMGITGLVSSYTTRFEPEKVNRSYNVKVAANALDGLLVTPGQEVSFNEVVGPRSSEAGYKTAGVIINNELVEGLGGGVCQVSSTLYNAVLLADLVVSERKNHSIPVPYVPVGRDATVVYDAVDFKFQNNTGKCIYIKSEVKGGQLTVKIFGDASNRQRVVVNSWVDKVLEPQIIYEDDENLKTGQQVVKQEGSKGYIVLAERVVYKDGVEIKKEKLPVSRYSAVDKIIAVGTGKPEPVIVPPTDMNWGNHQEPTIDPAVDLDPGTAGDIKEDNVEDLNGEDPVIVN